jgi:RimJ/RimL family protein N-acetyltransferase
MLNCIELSRDNIYLLPYSDVHFSNTVKWLNSKEIMSKFGITYSVTHDSHRAWILLQNDLMMWAVNVDGVYVGNISLRVNERHKKAYLEIYIGDSEFHGRGIGYSAVLLVIKYGFNVLGLNRIYLYTHDFNIPANKLYEKVGFIIEGVERQSVRLEDGLYRDQILWAMLSSEYRDCQ